MKTLAKVRATSYRLWWAINGVSLLFAAAKCGTTVRENPYTDMILFEKTEGGNSWIHSTAQRKEHSKTEFEKREF